MENKIFGSESEITQEEFGGKAFGLKWLFDNKIKVPKTYFARVFPSENSSDFESYANSTVSALIENAAFSKNRIAVRSSGITEDGAEESKAGNYKTKLNVDFDKDSVLGAVREVVQSGSRSGEKMGVVFQEMVDAEISGVLFTSNPLTYSKKECVVNFRNGIGEALVSGTDKGENRIVEKEKIGEIKEDWLKEVCEIGILSEKKFGKPLDMEFAVEKGSGKLYFLQCRPATGILFNENCVKKVSVSEIGGNNKIKSLDKIAMRLAAEKRDVMVSPAFVVCVNCLTDEFPIEKTELERSEFCTGYNVVVILPKLTDSKILRSFAGEKQNVSNAIACNRYGIRTFPEHGNVFATLKALYEKVKDSSWICTMIIQEIFDPLYTGIVRRNGDNFILEIARGHFVAKGIFPMSRYIIDENKTVLNRNEIVQEKCIRLIEGCKIEQKCGEKISLTDSEISSVISAFSSYLTKEKSLNLEIGILKKGGKIIPYLIDVTDEQKSANVQEDDILNGVISRGSGTGVLVRLERQSLDSSLDSHFKDSFVDDGETGRKEIYLCDVPDIALKNRLGKNCAGFLFKEGSLLCHLSVLLREKGIPALVGIDENRFSEGEIYEIDTSVSGTCEKKVWKI